MAMAAAAILLGVVAGSALLLRGVARAYALLEDERHSSLYCPPDALARGSAPLVPVAVPTPAGDAPLPCLPRRLDHAAPGAHLGEPPPAICAVLRAAGLRPQQEGLRPCTWD